MNQNVKLDVTLPHNPTTGRNYSGGNVPELLAAGESYVTPEWAGFGQWKKSGRIVSKGESCTAICYYMPKRDRKTGKPIVRNGKPALIKRTLRVFNIAQTIEITPEMIAAWKAAKDVVEEATAA